jgi:hypothetical protein
MRSRVFHQVTIAGMTFEGIVSVDGMVPISPVRCTVA